MTLAKKYTFTPKPLRPVRDPMCSDMIESYSWPYYDVTLSIPLTIDQPEIVTPLALL